MSDMATDMMEEDEPILLISTSDVNGLPVVVAQGDVDLCTTPQLRDALERTCESHSSGGTVAVDMREVPFIDSAGLALLVEVRKRFLERCQIALVIEKGSQPERVLRLGRFDTFLQVTNALEDVKSNPV